MTGQSCGQARVQGGCYGRDGKYIAPRAPREGGSSVKVPGIVLLPSYRRKNGIGITAELPSWRSVGWNVALIAVEACLVYWAHFAVGVAWTTLGAGFTAVAVLGVALTA